MASVATLRDLIEALIQSAKEEKKLDKIISDIERLFTILSQKKELKNILGSTAYSIEERQAIVTDLGLSREFDEQTINFLHLIIELERFKSLLNSKETFLSKLRKVSGRALAEITVAQELSDEELKKIIRVLNKVTDRKIEVQVTIDPEIIGGVIAKVEDKIFDGSIKTQLERMRSFLTAA